MRVMKKEEKIKLIKNYMYRQRKRKNIYKQMKWKEKEMADEEMQGKKTGRKII